MKTNGDEGEGKTTDIERSLDDLISNEGGRIFQGLAVVLARKLECEKTKSFCFREG